MVSKLQMGLQLRLLCLPLLFLFSSPSTTISSIAAAPFHVGVILDTDSWIGNMNWSCMAMAADEFYAANPNYTTRLALHLRRAEKDDALAAASAALDLLKNVQVGAIIGAQTSTQAKFLIDLGDRTHVPIISFSAKCPSLSSKQSPYFIRTTYNDSSQAKVLASIVQVFRWREVVPIFEDTDYGNGIIPYFTDALQEIDAQVPYRSPISVSANKDEIAKELNKLKSMRTRVFVVHMSYSLGFKLLSLAHEAGMMSEGYVWITTYGLTDIVDLMGSSATNLMQGVLGVKPYIEQTKKLLDFKVRWRQRFNKENPNAEVTEPSAFCLWGYDTVSSLAMAAEKVGNMNSTFEMQNAADNSTDFGKLGSSPIGPELVKQMASTDFDGMSGRFHLVDGELEATNFEIVNIVGHGKTRIGFWTQAHGISGRMDSKAGLEAVIWPGELKSPPKGWEWPTNGNTLLIGIPVKPGFAGFVTDKPVPRGYCIKVFENVMHALPYHVRYNYKAFEDAKGQSNGTYDELVYQVYLKNYDAVVGDITIVANRSQYVDFTLPYTESGVYMLVPVKDKRRKNAWTFTEPLTRDLWLASGAFFIFTGFVVWILEHRVNEEFRGPPASQFGTVVYFIFSTLVFSHRERIVSNLSRIVVIIWVFVVLILQQSYTASLASMLTVEQLQPTATDLHELARSAARVGYLNNSFVAGLLKRLNFDDSRLVGLNSPDEYKDALDNGTVSAVIDELPYIKVFLSKYCHKYAAVGPAYKTGGFGFAFPRGSPLVPDVSRAILNFTGSDKMIEIEKTLYGEHPCPIDGDIHVSSGSLTFNSFWGLFLITGITSTLAILVHLAFFLYQHWDVVRNNDSDFSLRKRLALLLKIYDQVDSASHAFKETEPNNGPGIADMTYTPNTNSEPESPLSISYHGHEEFNSVDDAGTLSEGGETPGRELGGQTPDPPSFADMLSGRREYDSS